MSATPLYNEFPSFLKRYFPYKVQKISLNAGFTCPNRDGEIRQRAGMALQYMLHDYSRFRVETIDSFFQSVMRNLARELELSPNLNIELNNSEVLSDAVDSLIEKLTPTSPVLAWLLDYIDERIRDDKRWNVSNEVKSFGRNIFDESYIERGEKLRQCLRTPNTLKLYRDVLRDMETEALEQMKSFYDQFEGELEGHALTPEDLKGGARGIGSYFRSQNRADSLALADTTNLQRKLALEALEAPIDTAALARQNDSIQNTLPPTQEKKRWIPNSNRTVWLGLVVPGAGQIYNRKYWKLPIIYGGFVGCAYALTWNGQMYKDYSQAYQDIMSNNPNNNSYMDFLPPGTNVNDRLEYWQEIFRKRKDLYRRQRDLSIFAFIGVYLLSVIDTYVDAELSDFDISKDLSMKWEPTVFNDAFRNRPQGVGLQCCIKF